MRALAGVASLLAVALAGTAPAQASFPGKPGRIAYSVDFVGGSCCAAASSLADIGLDYEIVTKKSDGSGERLLTDNTADDIQPAWSKDGRRIVYVNDGDASGPEGFGDSNLFVMRGDGTGVRQLTDLPEDEVNPAFSPDGRSVVFAYCTVCALDRLGRDAHRSARAKSKSGLWVTTTDGSSLRRLTKNPNDSTPTYSPSGRLIAFSRNGGIWLIRANGTHPHRLARGEEPTNPDFSPNGRRIVFDDYESLIYTVSVRGGRVRSLKVSGDVRDPVFAPNGRSVAYVHATHSRFDDDIDVKKLAGRGHRHPHDITRSNSLAADSPSWQALPR